MATKTYTPEDAEKVIAIFLSEENNTIPSISRQTQLSVNTVNIIINNYLKNKFKNSTNGNTKNSN